MEAVHILRFIQSGFRSNHSTETAVVKVFKDVQLNTDYGSTTELVLLDLSAAFRTADHSIIFEQMENWVGLCINNNTDKNDVEFTKAPS